MSVRELSLQSDTLDSPAKTKPFAHIGKSPFERESDSLKMRDRHLVQVASAALHGRRTVLPRVAVQAGLAVANRKAVTNIDDHMLAGRSRVSINDQIADLAGALDVTAVLKQRSRVSRGPIGAIQYIRTWRRTRTNILIVPGSNKNAGTFLTITQT